MRLMPRSLRSRLVLLFAVGTLGALAISLSLVFVVLNSQLRVSFDQDLDSRGNDLLAAVRHGDIEAVGSDPFAQIYNADGTVVFGSSSLTGERLLEPEEVPLVHGTMSVSKTLPLGPQGQEVRVRLQSRLV